MEWYEELYQTDAWRKESTLARFRLDGKKAFITGGAGGLGREIAGAFAEAGADVALVDLAAKQEYGESVAKEISDKFGTKTIYVPCDIGSDDDIKAMIATVRKEFGTIDISVNNAGFVYPHDLVDMLPLEDWNRCVSVNLTGCMLSARYSAQVMKEDGHGGAVVNTSSLMGFAVSEMFNQQAGAFVYGVTKAGIVQMTKTMSSAWAPNNIRVNSIAPGFVWSGIHAGVVPPEGHQYMCDHVPMKRFGSTQELASAYLFLASDAASYITGTNLMVDGGYLVY